MPLLRLVRHGHAAAGFAEDRDPGLDDEGRAQTAEMVMRVADLGPLPIVVSPLRRTRETAAPLEARWSVAAVVDDRVAEIPAPTDDLVGRGEWLRTALRANWADLGPVPRAWRDELFGALDALVTDTLVVTHFVAINAVIGRATGDDRVTPTMPGNCSVTTVEVSAGRVRLVDADVSSTTEVM